MKKFSIHDWQHNQRLLKEQACENRAKDLVDDYSVQELQDRLNQIMRDMEQEAEPEGGPIADMYGAEMETYERAISIARKNSGKGDIPYDVAVGKMTQDEYDKMMSTPYKVEYSKTNDTYRVMDGDKIVTDFATKERADAEAKRLNGLQSVKDVDKAQEKKSLKEKIKAQDVPGTAAFMGKNMRSSKKRYPSPQEPISGGDRRALQKIISNYDLETILFNIGEIAGRSGMSDEEYELKRIARIFKTNV